MDILSKNIIGCTITFTITERGKGVVTKNETIKEISYPDTIWTKEHGYALHYFEDKHDIVIKKDNVELTREEIVTQPRGFMFGKFECNWADEFDVEGTCAMLLEEYEYSYERSSRNLDKIFTPLTEEHYNECVKYETEVLKNLSPYEFNKKNPNEKVQMDKIRPYGAKECKSYSEYIQKFNKRRDLGKYEVGFGTNQDLEFTSKKEFWDCFEFFPISEEIYTFYKEKLGGETGKFPMDVDY